MRRNEFMPGARVRAVLAALFLAQAGLVSSAAFAQAAPVATAARPGDPVRGMALYQGCESCHSLNENDVGPKHRGVVGRRAGSVADYAYSPALKSSGLTWDEATLNRWLVNPSALVPGTKMFFKIDDAQGRADLIAYLKEQK